MQYMTLPQLLEVAVVNPHAVEQLMNLAERDDQMVELTSNSEIQYTAYGSLRNLYDDYFRHELMSSRDRLVV